MNGTWVRSASCTKIIIAGAVAIFLATEAMLAVASITSHRARSATWDLDLLVDLFVTACPLAMGLQGYFAVIRIRSKLVDTNNGADIILSLSRQYLLVAVFGYAAVVLSVHLLG